MKRSGRDLGVNYTPPISKDDGKEGWNTARRPYRLLKLPRWARSRWTRQAWIWFLLIVGTTSQLHLWRLFLSRENRGPLRVHHLTYGFSQGDLVRSNGFVFVADQQSSDCSCLVTVQSGSLNQTDDITVELQTSSKSMTALGRLRFEKSFGTVTVHEDKATWSDWFLGAAEPADVDVKVRLKPGSWSTFSNFIVSIARGDIAVEPGVAVEPWTLDLAAERGSILLPFFNSEIGARYAKLTAGDKISGAWQSNGDVVMKAGHGGIDVYVPNFEQSFYAESTSGWVSISMPDTFDRVRPRKVEVYSVSGHITGTLNYRDEIYLHSDIGRIHATVRPISVPGSMGEIRTNVSVGHTTLYVEGPDSVNDSSGEAWNALEHTVSNHFAGTGDIHVLYPAIKWRGNGSARSALGGLNFKSEDEPHYWVARKDDTVIWRNVDDGSARSSMEVESKHGDVKVEILDYKRPF